MKTSAAYSLLMAIAMTTMSTTTSEPICSRHESRRQCHSNNCTWLRRNRTCVPSPSEEECDSRTAFKSCRLIGCKWDFDATKCDVKRLDQSRDSMDEPREDREERDDPDEERSDKNEDNSGFWISLIGMDADEAMESITNKFGDYYKIFLCGRENRDVQCNMRNFDPQRVKLSIDENRRVENVIMDEPRGDVSMDEPREERDDPDEETSDINEDHSGFWISMIGMDADEAMESITNKFGDYYKIFLCGRENSDVQCSLKNIDYQRVKLNIDENRRVENVVMDVTREEREARDDPEEETSDENEDNSGFWISMTGMDADEAMESITNKFGDYYKIFMCGRENRDFQCDMRNYDYQRVKLNIDENRRVEMAAIG